MKNFNDEGRVFMEAMNTLELPLRTKKTIIKDFTISANIPSDQLKDYSDLGIDYDMQIFSVLQSEIKMNAYKQLCNEALNTTDYEDHDLSYLKDILNNNSNIIVNGQIATYIQNLEDFNKVEVDPQNPGTVYFIGKFNDCNIYVDPMILWKDLTMLALPAECFDYKVTSIRKIEDPGLSAKITVELIFVFFNTELSTGYRIILPKGQESLI